MCVVFGVAIELGEVHECLCISSTLLSSLLQQRERAFGSAVLWSRSATMAQANAKSRVVAVYEA